MNKIIPLFFLAATFNLTLVISIFTFAADKDHIPVVTPPAAKTPVGQWRTIDDNDKKERAIIEVFERDGKLFGKIVKTFPREKDKEFCEKCTGELKDAQIVGLEILKGISRESADSSTWSGGTILDPQNGKDYKVYAELQDDDGKKNAKLKVRGYIGFALLGRTQYWYRLN